MNITLIIYIIGMIVSYYMMRKIDKSFTYLDYTWFDVLSSMFSSLLSWITVLVISPLYIKRCVKNEFIKKLFSKLKTPPTWL